MRRIAFDLRQAPVLYRHGGTFPPERRPRLDFSVNVNPHGPPLGVLQALRRQLPAIARYPDPECGELTSRLARLHALAPAQVVVGNGSNDLIHALTRAVRPRQVALVEPAYTEYLRAALLAGAAPAHWLPDDPGLTPQPFDPQGAELLWLGHPGNPTGHVWQRDLLAEWIAAHPRTLFAVDEAFLPFLDDEAEHSLLPLLDRLPNLIVLRSFTKVYALPGLRLGYAAAAPELAARLREQVVPWSVNTLAQTAGLAALDDAAFLARTRAWLAAESVALRGQLAGLAPHLEPLPGRACFVLLRLQRADGPELVRRLAEVGIALRDASNFVGLDAHHVRVAVRTAADNRRLVQELRTLLVGA